MNDEQFNTLLASVEEAGQIQRGERPASRTFHLEPPHTPENLKEPHAFQYPMHEGNFASVACQA